MSEQYPTEEELNTIKNWNPNDLIGLMEFIKPLWAFDSWGWSLEGGKFYLSTGGWSGNESIVEALESNIIWWAMFWQESRRGGHYMFAPLNLILKEAMPGLKILSPNDINLEEQ
jgi:hypothetical protein